MSKHDDLTPILHALQDGKTRATYGAVAEQIGAVPMFLMNGRPRNPLHSWVVSKQTGMPSGYTEDERHIDLLENSRVIQDADELAGYLDGRS